MVDTGRVTAMRDAMTYRGPDSAGLTSSPGCVLGHRRLSIIDLSENGAQPMSNEDGSVEVVFNGAIYNFLELREELEGKGHVFRSRTDTEVLVHGCEEWGIDGLLKRISGMYAFCLVDHVRHQIHLARDTVGKKPLFFSIRDGELAFASSSRALLKGLRYVPEVDPIAIDQLLCHLYISGPRSVFKEVEKLLPGHALTLDANGKRRDFTHAQVDFLRPKQVFSEEEWLERIAEVLKTAIRRRLIADVPIGVLLSGGVDSSLVTALAAEICPRVRTFSVATEDPELDERRFSRAVAEAWGTDHHELEVGGDLRKSLCWLVGAMGEPLADASAANVFAIAEKAREMVTVVLTGDGGDEAFGGYHHFLGYYLAERARNFLVRPALPLLAAAGRSLSKSNGLSHQAGTFLQMTASPVDKTLFAFHSAMSPSVRSQLYTSDFEHEIGGRLHNAHYVDALPKNGNGSWDVDRVMQAYMVTTLPDDYLAKVDSGTMAMSLEARSPFLDVDLLRLAGSIPAPMRFRRAKAKSLLRSLALRYIPRQCVQRRKKGFAAPIHLWLRGDWRDIVEEFVLGAQVKTRGWFRLETLQQVVAEHARGIDHSELIWGLLILEIWMRLSLDGSLSTSDAL